MSIQLNIGANVQPVVDGVNSLTKVLDDFAKKGQLSIGVIEKSMQDLRNVIKNTTDPTELNKLKSAYQALQAQLNAFKTESGLTQQLGGISRATRIAHTDLEQISQSIRGLATGSERGVDALSNIVFSFERLKGITGGIKPALAALGETLVGPAGLVLAFTTLVPLAEGFISKLFETGEASKAAAKQAEDFKKQVQGIFEDTGKEAANVAALISVLKSETETRERKLAAIKELQKIQPDVFNNLKLEGDAVSGLDDAYKKYLQTLPTVIAAKIKQAQLEDAITKLLQKQGATTTGFDKNISDFNKALDETIARKEKLGQPLTSFELIRKEQAEKAKKEISGIQSDIEGLEADLVTLSNGVKIKIDKPDTKPAEDSINNLISLAEKAAKFFQIPVDLQISNFDSQKAKLKKALDTFEGIRDFKIKIKIDPQIDLSGRPIEPKIEDLPIDLGTVGIDLKGKEKFDNRLAEGISKGIIIPITPQVRIEDLKGVPSTDQEKILVDLTKQFAIFGDVGRRALQKINFQDPADQIKAMQKELLNLTIQFNDIKTIADSVGQAFGDAFLAITKGENPIKAFFNSIIHSLEQLIAKLIATKIAAALLNAFFPGSSFGLKALSLVIPGRAEGGPVEGGQPYVVGERGHELFVPNVRGSIIPNHQLRSFGQQTANKISNLSSSISNKSFSDISKTVNNFYHSTINNSSIVANKSIKSFSLNDAAPTNSTANPSVVDFNKQLKSNYFINNLIDVSKFSASLPHLQTGGITTSDTIAQLHKAEVIMPLDRLKGLLGNNATETNVNVGGEFTLRGEDLALTLDRFARRRGRTF